MKLNQNSGMTIAAAAAALILSGATLAGTGSATAEAGKGHCMGVNACRVRAPARPRATTAKA